MENITEQIIKNMKQVDINVGVNVLQNLLEAYIAIKDDKDKRAFLETKITSFMNLMASPIMFEKK